MRSPKHIQQVVLLVLAGATLAMCNNLGFATFEPDEITVTTITWKQVVLRLTGLSETAVENIHDRTVLRVRSLNTDVAEVNNPDNIVFSEVEPGTWHADITVDGIFLGRTFVVVELRDGPSWVLPYPRLSGELEVTTLRPERLIDTLFYVAIIVLLAILFVNFGCAINKAVIIAIIKRPIGPAIGSLCQIGFLPLISYGLGLWLFPDQPELALGLFMTGITPAGGASNIYTLLLDGNIDLSISMTTISTLASFGTMPLWLFLLGRQIFYRANLGVPYGRVAIVAFSLLGPLCLGLLIQKFFPRLSKFLVRILKPLALVFIILIVIFGLVTNLYMLQLFAWQILVAGIGLPVFGSTVGWITAKIFCQNAVDSITISVETGIQNTGMTMFILTFALDQPAADITLVIPIAVSIFTPVPVILIYLIRLAWRKTLGRKNYNNKILDNESVSTPTGSEQDPTKAESLQDSTQDTHL